MKKFLLLSIFLSALIISCKPKTESKAAPLVAYFYQDSTKVMVGGAQLIMINTPKGIFSVWTKRIGNNPKG